MYEYFLKTQKVEVCVFEDEIVTLFDVLSVKSKVLQDHLRQ